MPRKIQVDINDLVEDWRVDTNTLANQVGELDDLTDSGQTVVSSINNITAINDRTKLVAQRVLGLIDSHYDSTFPLRTHDIGDSNVTLSLIHI